MRSLAACAGPEPEPGPEPVRSLLAACGRLSRALGALALWGLWPWGPVYHPGPEPGPVYGAGPVAALGWPPVALWGPWPPSPSGPGPLGALGPGRLPALALGGLCIGVGPPGRLPGPCEALPGLCIGPVALGPEPGLALWALWA